MSSGTVIAAAANHLWQSTLLAAVATRIAIALRANRAAARYRVWLLASVKFLAPFAILIALGSHLKTRSLATPPAAPLALIDHFGQPFAPPAPTMALEAAPHALHQGPDLVWVLLFVWVAGALSVLSLWFARWTRARRVLAQAAPVSEGRETRAMRRICEQAGLSAPLRVVSSSSSLEPGVFGLFRPVLFLPDGIADRLSCEQLEAVIAHEVWHVMRRDNLLAAIHMLIEALFWFHPLVWWIGARLVEEREHACGEAVLRMGSEPHVYAEGILQTCRFYVESPVPCMSGVTGSDLKQRIVRIMSTSAPRRIGLGKKLLLAAAGIAAFGGPVIFGLYTAPEVRAQEQTANAAASGESFEVASIRPGNPSAPGVSIHFNRGGGRFQANNVPLKMLIRVAYHIQDFQVTGLPAWATSEPFNIEAKPAQPDEDDPRKMKTPEFNAYVRKIEARLQALLADRFNLTVHRETKDMPVYQLVISKSGPKLIPSAPNDGAPKRGIGVFRGRIEATESGAEMIAQALSDQLGRSVIDRTGLTGKYDFKLEWAPDPAQSGGLPQTTGKEPAPGDASGPSIFTALQEQLGLKLESAKGPVEILVIDRVEKPSPN